MLPATYEVNHTMLKRLFRDLINSCSRPRKCVRSEDSNKFIIVTFYTEGFPHDHGTDLVAVEQYFQKIVRDHADKYMSFNPRTLLGMDPIFSKCFKDYTSWLEQHPNRNQLGKYNPGWARLGFQMWKPFLIQHILNSEEVKTGDIVLYHDVNFLNYPTYILGCEQWRGLSSNILNKLKCDIFIPKGLPLKKDVKTYLIRKFLGKDYFEKNGLWNGLIVMRKSEMALRFISEWAGISSQLENISPLPNPDPHPDFIWHSVDQSTAGVLACMWRSNKRLPMDWPRYELRGRRFSEEAVIEPKGNISAILSKIWLRTSGYFWHKKPL